MLSQISLAIGLKHHLVALILTDEKPEGAQQFTAGRWGCVMSLFATAAAKGKSAAIDKDTYGCWGGGVGLGFGEAYQQFPGGVECFAHFLSSGNRHSEVGRQIGAAMEGTAGAAFAEEFLEGERYVQSPELVKQWLSEVPITQIPTRYVVFKPLEKVQPDVETPSVVVALADPDQLSALVILANYGRPGAENVIIPWAAGCQTIGVFPYRETATDRPRAVVGMTDISARKIARGLLGDNLMTFAMPWRLFLEMESNVAGSFLERPTWQSLGKTPS